MHNACLKQGLARAALLVVTAFMRSDGEDRMNAVTTNKAAFPGPCIPRIVSFLGSIVLLVSFVANSCPLHAHPVPRRCHDRTLVVHLGPDAITVDYRLEVDEFTVVFDDLPALGDQVDLTKLRQPHEFYESFTRCYAPILGANLIAKLDGRPVEFQCLKHGYTLRDENGIPLDHLRCDFVFQAKLATLAANSSDPHRFTFKEGNYELEEGQIRLSLIGSESVKLLSKTEPDAKLKTLPPAELQPGDDAKLRRVEATFTIPTAASVVDSAKEPAPPATAVTESASPSGERR
jgi:hypothetical protein